ncbi:MAG TPA: MerR family transcriptional regulator [Candidatus Deferrimicrobium sp.]|nr:MerR family transcriptional regulator [Candidatus Deferrimicrobium sp.]
MTYTIGKVADMAHVSVRTLHYYDAIDLLNPSYETASGYRLYADSDLESLQQILFFRSLGFPLAQIKAIVKSPTFDRREALEAHRTALLERCKAVERLLAAVGCTIEAMDKGETMDTTTMFDAFDEHALEEHRTKYAEEAQRKWGGTNAWAESQRKTSAYTKEDWKRIQQEGAEIREDLAALMGRSPSDQDVQALVKRFHEYMSTNFYACSLEMLSGLGDMYVSDPRFTATYDKVKPGLALFIRDAIKIYCTANGE